MMSETITAPYIHTNKDINERPKDWGIALLPVLIWSVFMFGARVISLSVVGAGFSLGFDYLTRRFALKNEKGARLDFMALVYGILAIFAMPVTVPLFMPIVSSALVVTAKNIRVIRGKRLFNPFIFSSAVLNLLFPSIMTAFTRPFAYFSAFDFVIDPKLMAGYRVISPLQYMADGSVYEDGVIAQFYGFASGHIGEIAVAAMILSLIWLAFRKEADPMGTIAVIFTILLLGLAFPSGDAESNYYAYSVILSGGIVFISVFAMNESHTVPLTPLGKILFGAVCGILIFIFRKVFGGIEFGYYIVLALNAVSPFIETMTRPKDNEEKKNQEPSAIEKAFASVINKIMDKMPQKDEKSPKKAKQETEQPHNEE